MDSYLLLKSLHLLGVVLFIGNIVVTGWWKVMADRTRNPAVVAFAQRQVTLTDWVFTLGGSMLVGIAGLVNALVHDIPLNTPWLLWGGGLFLSSALIWGLFLIPLQIRLGAMARAFAGTDTIPEEYWPLSRNWLLWGTAATLLPVAVIPVMVFKGV
ncbi:MAG TPA: DUF2269 family protein [Candidatus Sulfotelmatobacter sp.]|jgi:uncharacterized membrane protein|nr:DUF2269 family protein [Candidatus Sulfotelmatobacter sp.]